MSEVALIIEFLEEGACGGATVRVWAPSVAQRLWGLVSLFGFGVWARSVLTLGSRRLRRLTESLWWHFSVASMGDFGEFFFV